MKYYSSKTVRSAHRRVLRLVCDVLFNMSETERLTLRADSNGGIITLDEVMDHAAAALDLKEKRDK